MRTWLTERLGLAVPLVGAPMAGASGGALAGAISAAGGLGMVGVPPSADSSWILAQGTAAAESGRPYGVGLMAWAQAVAGARPDAAPGSLPAQVESALALRPALVSLSFGDYAAYVEPLRAAGILVATQAGTVADARAAQDAGVDVIVARGAEGGGHGRDAVATLPLLQEVLDAVELPVLAAGGISGPRGLAAVVAAGAAGAWAGTAFLGCREASNAPAVRQRLIVADATSTVYGTVFDAASRAGWPDEFGGRALRNPFFDRWQGHEAELAGEQSAHEHFVDALRTGDLDTMSLYAGQGVGALNSERSAAEVVADFARADEILRAATDRL